MHNPKKLQFLGLVIPALIIMFQLQPVFLDAAGDPGTDPKDKSVFVNGSYKVTLAGNPSFRFIGSISTIRWSDDGKNIMASCVESTAPGQKPCLKIWDAKNGKELKNIEAGEWYTKNVVFSPDGKYALGAGASCKAFLWDLQSGDVSQKLELNGDMDSGYAFSADGGKIAVGSHRFLKVWDIGGKEISDLEKTVHEDKDLSQHTYEIRAVAFSTDGKTLFSASRHLVQWDIEKAKEIKVFDGPQELITCMSLTSDSATLICGYENGKIRSFDVKNGKQIKEVQAHKSRASSILLNKDDDKFFSGTFRDFDDAEALCAWDLKTFEKIREYKGFAGTVSSLSLSPDGKMLAASGVQNRVHFWDVGTGKMLPSPGSWLPSESPLLVLRDGKHLLCEVGGEYSIWNLKTRKEVWSSKKNPLSASATDLGGDKEALDWRQKISSSSTARGISGNYCWELMWTPPRAIDNGTRNIVDRRSGQIMKTWLEGDAVNGPLAFSPDGNLLAIVMPESVELWDIEKDSKISEAKISNVSALAFSFGGEKIFCFSDGKIKGFDLKGKEDGTAIDLSGFQISKMAFSEDGNMIYASGGNDGSEIKVIDSASGKIKETLICFTDPDKKDLGSAIRQIMVIEKNLGFVVQNSDGIWMIFN